MQDVFLSYSREDQAVARRFAEGLQREGFGVWWDQTLSTGENYDQVTEQALREAKAVVVLWSKTSVDSRWVRAEATQADRLGTLMPVMIEACTRPIMFELKHTADLAHWNGEAKDATWRAFVSDVARFTRNQGMPAPASVPAGVATPATHDARRAMLFLAGLLVLLAAVGAGTWYLTRAMRGGNSATPATQAQPVSIAVLPFANLSSDPEQEYFSDGLTEEILNQLAQIQALRVTGRTSSFAFKGRNEDLRTIAHTLGVAHLLEGSVRRSGGELRITAQLIDGTDGAHRWSHTYDLQLKDVFSVQEQVARDVAQALRVTLDVGELPRAQGGTTNVEAYDKFLQAHQLTVLSGAQNRGRAVVLLREAVELDPQFVRAWFLLRDSLWFAVAGQSPALQDSILKERDAAARRVIELAPDHWAAKVIRVDQLLEQRQWADADALSSEIWETNRLTVANWELGGARWRTFMLTGRPEAELRSGSEVLSLDPLNFELSQGRQRDLDTLGRHDEAQAEYERSKSLHGERWGVEFATLLRMLGTGNRDAAAVGAQLRVVLASGNVLPFLSGLSEVITDRSAAAAKLRALLREPVNQVHLHAPLTYQLADALGDQQLALEVLRNMVADNGFHRMWMAPYSGVRSTPGFKQLVRDTGLADFFFKTGNWSDFCKPVGTDDFECH